MTSGVTSNDTRAPRPSGPARYRVNEHGTHVVIVPSRCPSGRHVLATSGYRIVESSDTLTVTCRSCSDAAHQDHSWIFSTGAHQAQSAEFDDAPYSR